MASNHPANTLMKCTIYNYVFKLDLRSNHQTMGVPLSMMMVVLVNEELQNGLQRHPSASVLPGIAETGINDITINTNDKEIYLPIFK
ncbi:unnamed protein product, partial [Allacma fusca]